jgi:BirA family transcriptional regulator, biotin operon repressor / biotin---[acetyl-CoA-carboxylase] ligase
MNTNRKHLLKQLMLRKGTFVSGQQLSEQLQISRAAVWKHIDELKKEGFEIEAVRKQGYRLLKEPDRLSAAALHSHLATKVVGQQLRVLDAVGSTQQVAHQLAREGAPSGSVVIANHQTGGRGRLGRKWYSPPGTGIWMSIVIRPDMTLHKAPQLTLLTSVAVLRALHKETGQNIHIKWPNDLLLNGRKLAGILTELNAEADRVQYAVIGIGINVNQKVADFPEELATIATSLAIEKGDLVDRKACILSILKEWEDLYELYEQHGFSTIKTLWELHSASLGEKIVARTMDGQFEGIAKGITDEGVLLLEDARGHVQRIYSADIET